MFSLRAPFHPSSAIPDLLLARSLGFLLSVCLSACLLTSPLQSQDGQVDGGMRCTVEGNTVELEWTIAFFAPIAGFELLRDGETIASLPDSASRYVDRNVSAGEHRYDLLAIPLDPVIDPDDPDSVTGTRVASCAVKVETSEGLRCRVDGSRVHLEWGPILIRIAFDRFRIERNGQVIAHVPSDTLQYVDNVFSLGDHKYEVFIVAANDTLISVGTCGVSVTCFGVKTAVEGLDVELDWSHQALPELASRIFTISRDGEPVGRTRQTRFTDTVPEPGVYEYLVAMEFAIETQDEVLGAPEIIDPPIRLIAACRVSVPPVGDIPRPPRNLECAVAIPAEGPDPVPLPEDGVFDPNDPRAIDADNDGVIDGLIPGALVSLAWENPQKYDSIVVTRNNLLIATLEGDATSFDDFPVLGGHLVYAVRGRIGDRTSRPATCEVDVPPTIVPPPRDLHCSFRRIWLEPDVEGDPAADGPAIAPVEVVEMRWWNPVPYEAIVVTRDNRELAVLQGDATSYRDLNPPQGEHVYGVRGVTFSGQSSAETRCRVVVDGEPVPPVRNLECVVNVLESLPLQFNVALSWDLGGRYDWIVITRNNDRQVRLPGSTQSWRDEDVEPGVYTYSVAGLRGEQSSVPVRCQVVVEGQTDRNLLYFSNSIQPSPDDTADPMTDSLRCLVNHGEPVQGWSFGVATDPRVARISGADIDGTDAAALNGGSGPEFLLLERVDDGAGVVMAAVISTGEPFDLLPAGTGQDLLNLQFEPGPESSPGERYAVRYTGSLGEPPVAVLLVIGGFEQRPDTAPGFVSFRGPKFLRGDANGDGIVDMSDALFTLEYLFLSGPEPDCLEAANVNASREVNIADPIFTLTWQFLGGVEMPPPTPDCGHAPAPLGCEDPGACASTVR